MAFSYWLVRTWMYNACMFLQWECCGAFGPEDWNLNIYFNCTDTNLSREKCGVPFSCCTKDPAVSKHSVYTLYTHAAHTDTRLPVILLPRMCHCLLPEDVGT